MGKALQGVTSGSGAKSSLVLQVTADANLQEGAGLRRKK
jgi:hypothetical protein